MQITNSPGVIYYLRQHETYQKHYVDVNFSILEIENLFSNQCFFNLLPFNFSNLIFQ